MEQNMTNQEQSTYGQAPTNGQQPIYMQQPTNGQPPVQQKSDTGRKVGYFFLSLTPFLACMAIQFGVAIVVGIGAAIIKMMQFMAQNPGASQAEAMKVYMDAISGSSGIMMLATHIILSLSAGIWYYFGCGRPKLKASVKNINVKAVILAVAGGLILCFLANSMVGVEMYIIPNTFQKYVDMMEAAGMGTDTLTIIAAILLAPIGEELICRGLTIYYAKKAFSKFFLVNILQALLFAVMHGNVIQGSYAFVLGLFLGYLAERFHSLLPCMLLHFVLNFSSTFFIDKIFTAIPEALWIYALLLAVSVLVVILLVWWGGLGKKKEA